MPTEEDRERHREALPGAISQAMRAAQTRLDEYLKSLGEAPPSVVVNSDRSGFVATVSREWLGRDLRSGRTSGRSSGCRFKGRVRINARQRSGGCQAYNAAADDTGIINQAT